tara:strand:- start:2245 stop:2346 length:102 start_codon:yes stop_codon:yes gene_type:complete
MGGLKKGEKGEGWNGVRNYQTYNEIPVSRTQLL